MLTVNIHPVAETITRSIRPLQVSVFPLRETMLDAGDGGCVRILHLYDFNQIVSQTLQIGVPDRELFRSVH